MEESRITLLSVTGNPGKVPGIVQNLVAPWAVAVETPPYTDEQGSFHVRLRLADNTSLELFCNSSEAYTSAYTQQLTSYFSALPLPGTALRTDIVEQVSLFNSILTLRYEVTENEERSAEFDEMIWELADLLAAFVYTAAGQLYAPDGKLVADAQGNSDFASFDPIAHVDYMAAVRPEETADADRRLRSTSLLLRQGLAAPADLRCAVTQARALRRAPQQVAQRAVCLLSVALAADSIIQGGKSALARSFVQELDAQFGVINHFTPGEADFLGLGDNTGLLLTAEQMMWRYESCAVLLWALGLMSLPGPAQMCDVTMLARLLQPYPNLNALVVDSRPIEFDQLLDATDLAYRRNWLCTDARVRSQPAPAGLDPGVVFEQCTALFWLTGVGGDLPWDEVMDET